MTFDTTADFKPSDDLNPSDDLILLPTQTCWWPKPTEDLNVVMTINLTADLNLLIALNLTEDFQSRLPVPDRSTHLMSKLKIVQ